MNGWFAVVSCESAQEQWVGPELGRAAVKLPRVAQHNSGSAVQGSHYAADMDIGIPIFFQFADLVPVLRQAQDREVALSVRRLVGASIEKPRPVLKLNHVIHMRRDADLLTEMSGGFRCIDTGYWLSRKGDARAEAQNQ